MKQEFPPVAGKYAPWGSNYHDHLCLCPGCNPQPPDEEGIEANCEQMFQEVPGGGCVALMMGEHSHEWIRDDEMVGLFHCADLGCDEHAVCPHCLQSIDVALHAEAAGLVVYWCPTYGRRAKA